MPSCSAPVRPPATHDVALEIAAVRALARASRLLERASGELNIAHYRVLSALAAGDERGSRIAARLALGKPTVSAAVEALCQRGLVARSKASGDQRVDTLRLTHEGEALLARTEAAMVARLDPLWARAPDPELVVRSLAQLGDAIEESVAARDALRAP